MATKVTRHRVGGPYSGPYGQTPMTHVAYNESRHLHPDRLPTRTRQKAVSIKLIDVSKDTMVNVQNVSATVKRLVAANLKLRTIPDDLVSSLVHLTKLDLSHNQLGDQAFPESMRKLEQLLEIRLNRNNLTKVPSCLRRLRNLTRLDISDNQVESPIGLDKLRKLQILVLDNNKLTSLFREISALKKLEILRCCRNNLREVPRDIRQLTSLVDLDISDNRISILPTDIFLLPKLDVLMASRNEVAKVPTFNIRPQNKHWVSHIDLSDNKLAKFPGHLLMMSSKLDLSGNKIRSLSYHAIKKLDVRKDQELYLEDNPLCYPPAEVCESGLKTIVSFFQESQSEVKVYQGLKVLVLGAHKSGKTSLIQTLVDQQPRMSEEIQDSSAGIDTYDLALDLEEEDMTEGRPGKALELSIWDFCGHPFYMYPHYVFFEQPTITILTFNMAEYSADTFDQHIGCWFDWMMAKTNKIVVILVGTQCDRLPKAKVQAIAKEVRTQLAEHIERQTERTKSRIRAIEERPHISPTLSEQLKAYMKLLQAKFTVQTDVISTSAKSYLGFDRVRQAIEALAVDDQLFPNVMRVIPTFWLDVQHYIEDRGNAMAFPVLKWEQFVEEVTSRFGMKHLMKAIAQYLHETGQILWFSKNECLKDVVFIRPAWLFDVFRSLFRHDFDVISFTPDDNQRASGLTSMKFERLKQETLAEAVLDRDLVRCLLTALIPADTPSVATDVVRLLTEGFELGYSVTKRQRDSTYTLLPETDSEGKVKYSKILVPWLRKTPEPEEFTVLWNNTDSNRKLVSYFRFPHYFPPGLFEIVCVRSHGQKHKLRFQHHWGGGFHSVHLQENVHVAVTYYQENSDSQRDQSIMLRYEVRDSSGDEAELTPAATMWTILLPLLMDFEELLGSYAGLLVERLTECPLCQNSAFLGEWLTPKETQGLVTRQCEACGQDVDTAFLVQPREKKRDDILRDVMRKARERRRGAALTTEISDISKLAPANPRRVVVANPELDMQEGLMGLLGNGDRSNSVVSELSYAAGGYGDGRGEERGHVPSGIAGLERKRSSRQHSLGHSSPTAVQAGDFFVTHAEENNDNEDGDNAEEDTSDEERRGSPKSVTFNLPGLAEFQRKMGLVAFSSHENDEEHEDGVDDVDDDDNEGDDQSEDDNGSVPPGLTKFRNRLGLI